VFPNPNEGTFMIDFGSKKSDVFDISLTDLYGNIVSFKNGVNDPSLVINIKDQTKGIYILKLVNRNNKNTSIHKIIVQ
jgi:hypothetical protein